MTIPAGCTQDITMQIYRLWDSQGPQEDSGSGGEAGSSVSLDLGEQSQNKNQEDEIVLRILQRTEKRNPGSGARGKGRRKRRGGRDPQGLGVWLPLPRPLGAVQSQSGSVSPVARWAWVLTVPDNVEAWTPGWWQREPLALSSTHSQHRWPQRGTVYLPAGVPKERMGR